MAITLGTFTQLDDGVLTGTFKTLNVSASLAIVPIDKTSDKAPDCATTIELSGRRQLGWLVFGDGLSPRRQADDN